MITISELRRIIRHEIIVENESGRILPLKKGQTVIDPNTNERAIVMRGNTSSSVGGGVTRIGKFKKFQQTLGLAPVTGGKNRNDVVACEFLFGDRDAYDAWLAKTAKSSIWTLDPEFGGGQGGQMTVDVGELDVRDASISAASSAGLTRVELILYVLAANGPMTMKDCMNKVSELAGLGSGTLSGSEYFGTSIPRSSLVSRGLVRIIGKNESGKTKLWYITPAGATIAAKAKKAMGGTSAGKVL